MQSYQQPPLTTPIKTTTGQACASVSFLHGLYVVWLTQQNRADDNMTPHSSSRWIIKQIGRGSQPLASRLPKS